MASNITGNTTFPDAFVSTKPVYLTGVCSWTRSESLCLSTLIPIFMFCSVSFIALIYFCVKTSRQSESKRIGTWLDSQLVPESIKGLKPNAQQKLFKEIKDDPLSIFFDRCQLPRMYLELCATEGVATLGELLHLGNTALRDIGFSGVHLSSIRRSIGGRALALQRRRNAAMGVNDSNVTTLMAIAGEGEDEEDQKFLVLQPDADLMRRHMILGIRAALQLPNEVMNEDVSTLYWDLLLSSMREHPDEAHKGTGLRVTSTKHRDPIFISREFYHHFRNEWRESQSVGVTLSVAFVAEHGGVTLRHKPAIVQTNLQFWQGFLFRWNQHAHRDRERKRIADQENRTRWYKQRQLEHLRQKLKHRATMINGRSSNSGTLNSESGMTASTSSSQPNFPESDAVFDENDVDLLLGEYDVIDTTEAKHETYSIEVRLVRTHRMVPKAPAAHNNESRSSTPDLDALLAKEMGGAGTDPLGVGGQGDNRGPDGGDSDDDDALFREVVYPTTIQLWNAFVHEFQDGELRFEEDGTSAASRVARGGKRKTLLRILQDQLDFDQNVTGRGREFRRRNTPKPRAGARGVRMRLPMATVEDQPPPVATQLRATGDDAKHFTPVRRPTERRLPPIPQPAAPLPPAVAGDAIMSPADINRRRRAIEAGDEDNNEDAWSTETDPDEPVSVPGIFIQPADI